MGLVSSVNLTQLAPKAAVLC